MQKRKKPCLFDTDRVATGLWNHLLRDFRTSEGPSFCKRAEAAFTDLEAFRGDVFPEIGIIPAGRFKRYAQLQNLLKKYRFANDVLTDEQLQEKTLSKYFTEQERLATYKPLPPLGFAVVRRARTIARRILGEYKPQDTIKFARFGKKSSIGCPLSLAYIDEKLSNVRAFTGSSQCSRWFFEAYLSQDELLSHIVAALPLEGNDENLQHESLNLVNVPKSWKTYRTITPLTLLSLFYSYGVGQQVTDRLAEHGLDIRRLQARHQNLVKKFSLSKTHATADLSAASDSLVSENLNRILPRKWYCALKKAMTHQVCVKQPDGIVKSFYTESVLPMGNGFTFPVETLVFYCIIKAIGELAKVEGVFSVFGDDLIYPSKLHKYVRAVFPQLKLVLNLDKTFVKAPFRESCGADFYRGVDVRPYFLQGERQLLTRSQYSAFLYKAYNGLTRRWHEDEIRSTLYYLLTEIAQVEQLILRVPPSYPDTAGIKVTSPGDYPLGMRILPWSPVSVLFTAGSRWYRFHFLMATSKKRFIKSQLPYYWQALKRHDDDPEGLKNFWDHDYSYLSEAPSQAITWQKIVIRRTYMRNGKRCSRNVVKYSPPMVSSREGVDLTKKLTKTGSISDWI
jgi:hypothetical protein